MFGWQGWKEPQIDLPGITASMVNNIMPLLADNLFKPSPIFERLRSKEKFPSYGGDQFRVPFQYGKVK